MSEIRIHYFIADPDGNTVTDTQEKLDAIIHRLVPDEFNGIPVCPDWSNNYSDYVEVDMGDIPSHELIEAIKWNISNSRVIEFYPGYHITFTDISGDCVAPEIKEPEV